MLGETFRFIYRYKFLILKTSLPLTLILLIGLVFLLVGYNLEQSVKGFENRYSLEIFLEPTVDSAALDTLKLYLNSQPGFDHLEVVTSQNALDKMTEILGEDPTRVLGYNPLPMSVVFYPSDNYKNRTYLEILKQEVEKFEHTDQAVFAGEWLSELENFNSYFIKVSAVFMVLVVAAYIFLFQMTLSHLWLKHQPDAGKFYLMGLSRFEIRTPVYLWSLCAAIFNILLSFALLKMASDYIDRYFVAVKFFEPQQLVALAIVFSALSIILAIVKPMKIPSYE